MFFFIPAGDVMTGKKVNLLSDIVAAYKDENTMTIFVIKAENRARPIFLTSHTDEPREKVGQTIMSEHTQTRVVHDTEILNIITINATSPGSFTGENAIGMDDSVKGTHWVMK